MAALTELNKVSIAQIAVFVPALAIAILLSVRHGFGRSSGWLFLVLLSLMRIVGAALQLATINDPANVSLIIGAATLQNIGLSALLLCSLGLVSRVLSSVNKTVGAANTLLQPRLLRLVQLVVLVGLILGIVGGTQQSSAIGSGRPYTVSTESRVGTGLMIAGFGILVIATAMLALQLGSIEHGEKRLLLAVALALPFILVRLVFSGLTVFDSSNPDFRAYGGSPNYVHYLIGMSVVMEMVTVAIYEGVGLLLQTLPKPAHSSSQQQRQSGWAMRNLNRPSRNQEYRQQAGGYGQA